MDTEYIKKSHKTTLKENKEKFLHGKLFYVQDPLTNDVDVDYVIEYIEKRIPSHLMHFVDSIYVGNFDFLNKKNVNALYKDDAIYVSNNQTNEEDMIDDIVHETAHSVEKLMNEEIYFDGEIEREFVGKRQRLCSLLNSEGYTIPPNTCLQVEYNDEFDRFLYQEVGYETLTSISMGLFYSPYAATSLREYFANGFEHYFIGDRKYLNNVSPKLYNKLTDMIH
jgi:hypothetical protein